VYHLKLTKVRLNYIALRIILIHVIHNICVIDTVLHVIDDGLTPLLDLKKNVFSLKVNSKGEHTGV